MNPEINIQICRVCQKKKVRIKVGKYANSKDNRYVDDGNRLWNGLCCAQCNIERTKQAMRVRRARTSHSPK